MQLHLVLPQVEPTAFTLPSVCPRHTCEGTEFRLHQQVTKPLKDTMHRTVPVHRYQCLRCGHTFRIYPQGVTHAHTSRRVQQLAVLLYLLGLSFGAVSAALDVFGIYLSKSRVYDAVQAVKVQKPQLTRRTIFETIQRRHLDRAVLHVRCMGQWLPLTLIADGDTKLVLTVNTLSPAEVATLREQITPLVVAMGGQLLAVATCAGDDGDDRVKQDAQ